MSETLELMKAKQSAGDLELIPWWRSKIPYLTPIGYLYVNGEPRRYYRLDRTGDYYYRRVSESEMHRWR